MKATLLTGFPGFITTQIIRQLIRLNKTNHIDVLILPSERKLAEEKRDHILAEFGDVTFHIVEGDITKPNLGVSDDQIKKWQQEIEVVWHLAAIYDLAVPRDIAWKVNVEGTKHVNELVSTLPNMKRYMYFSTAYVAGTRDGVLKEDELIRPDEFKNYYEETKYEAELLVEQLKENVPVTIIRPGIVRGHSETGETIKFDGPYFFLNMIDRLKGLPIIPYVGRSEAFINVVPIDYILQAAVYLSDLPDAAGKTVHLTDPNPHPVQEVYRAMVVEMTGKSPRGHLPLGLAKKSMSILPVRKALGVEQETLDYLTWNASFDTTVAENLLRDSGIECADFIQSMPAMVKFYNENKKETKYHIAIR